MVVSVQLIADLVIGDLVFWHDDPFADATAPSLGWVLAKGRETITVLVFSENAGLIEKQSVRHKADEFWKDNEFVANWTRHGCFTVHPTTELLRELKSLLTKLKMDSARTVPDEAARRGRPPKVELEVVE